MDVSGSRVCQYPLSCFGILDGNGKPCHHVLWNQLYLQIDWNYAKSRFWSSLVTSDSRSCRAMHFNHIIISPAYSMPAQKLSYSSRSIPFVGGIWHGCLQAKQPGRNSAPWIQCVWAFASTALCSTKRPVCKVRLGVGEMFEVCSLYWAGFSSKKLNGSPLNPTFTIWKTLPGFSYQPTYISLWKFRGVNPKVNQPPRYGFNGS